MGMGWMNVRFPGAARKHVKALQRARDLRPRRKRASNKEKGGLE